MAERKAHRPRDYRLDFFRGLALFLIFIDHIPDNFLGWFTLPTVAFSDAAEVFIFISGYAAAMVYGRALEHQGALFTTARIYKRVWQLYVAHLCLFMLFNAEVSYTVQRFNNPMYNDELRVGDFLAEPDVAIIKALTLQFQPTFLDILPLYITLLMVFPLILTALRRTKLLVLIPSFLLYAAVQIWDLNLPAYPEGRSWFFDPLAWQLPFVIGAAFGYAQVHGHVLIPRRAWLIALAAFIAGMGCLIRLSWVFHGFWESFPALFMREIISVDKTTLAPVRMINFLALALLVSQVVPLEARFLRTRAAWPIIICGQNSLQVFCFSILLALLGHFVMVEVSDAIPIQLAVNLGGILLMIGLGYLLSWYANGGKLPGSPAQAPVADEARS
jgi:hypothetical protein